MKTKLFRIIAVASILLAMIPVAVFTNVGTALAVDISTQVAGSVKDISQVYATMAYDNTVVSNYFGKNAAGTAISSAMVFTGITIPANCYIYQAYITFKADASLSTSMSAAPPVIYGEDAAAPADYGAAEDFTARSYTTASVSWTPASWTLNASYNTSDLTAIVQELYTSYAPYAAGSMAFEILGTAGTAVAAYRSAYSWDCGTPANAPILVIEYAPLDAYWVGGSGNHLNAAAHWALSSGGTPDAAYLPQSETNMIYDAHSNEPTDTSYAVNFDAVIYCHDLLVANPSSGTVSFTDSVASNFTIYGSLSFAAGVVWNTVNQMPQIFAATTSETITTNGVVFYWIITFSGVGGTWTLQDDWQSSAITLSAGTLNTNGKTVTLTGNSSNVFNMTGTSAVILGSSIINTYTWATAATNTITANTSTINVTGETYASVFWGSGKTYNNVVLSGLSASTTSAIMGANTFANLTLQGTDVINALAGMTDAQTVTGTFTCTGYSSSHPLMIFSNTLHTQRTITAANVVATDTYFRDIIGAGADDWDFDAQDDIGDCGGNTNIEFPASLNIFAVQGIGNYNWSNPAKWASSSGGVSGSGRVPLPQDMAIFDANSMSVNGVIVTLDQSYISGIDTTNVTKSPQFDATTEYLHNSIKLGACLWNVTTATYMMGQTAQALGGDLSYGNGDLYLDIQGGSVALNNDLIVGDDLFLTSGVFETTGYDVTAERFDSSTTTYTRSLWMGDSTFTLNDIAAATKWNVSATNMNVDSITSTIIFTNSAATTSTFTPGTGLVYYDLRIEGAGAYTTAFSAATTFHNLIIDRTAAAKTISGAFTITLIGTLSIPIYGVTVVTITNVDFTKTSGLVASDYLTISGSSAGGGALYYACTHSTNAGGNAGWDFVSCAIPPTISSVAATGIGENDATLRGSIDNWNSWSDGYYFFEYSLTGTYTGEETITVEVYTSALGTKTTDISGLTDSTQYHYRMGLRYNGVDYAYTVDSTFYTLGIPIIDTEDASDITINSATLVGNVVSMGVYSEVSVRFQWGETVSYGSTSAWVEKVDVGVFTLPIADLQLNTTYHFRTQLIYLEGATFYTLNGDDNTFTTLRTIAGSTVIQVLNGAVFQSYTQANDLLFTAEVTNTYPPYYIVTNPSQYFAIQLLDPTGATIIAATPLRHWGMSPVSIYLSPNSASHITWGDPYIIRMIGLFPTPPSDTYTLLPEDWKGSDLDELDSWMIATAEDMNVYYEYSGSQSLTTKVSGVGALLTDEGGAYFTSSISGIMTVRPDIFEITRRNPKYSTGTVSNAYDADKAWEEQVGTVIAGDADVIGDVLGIQPKQLLSFGIWAFYLFMVLFVFFNTKGADTPFVLLLNIPVLFIGLNFRLIEFQVFAVASVISVLLWLIKVWFSK